MTRGAAIAAVPCKTCPFRKDRPIYLRPDRRREIAEAVADGQTFHCHSTVDYDVEDDDWGENEPDTSDASICAGAAKALMASGGTMQMMRIAERLGLADLDKTAERGVEVWDLDDWPRLAEGSTGEKPEWEIGDEDGVITCETVNENCLAPAGMLTPSGAVLNGLDEADGECVECGAGLCSECADETGRCGMCHVDDDEEDD